MNTVIFFLIHLRTEYGHHESSGHVASCSGEKRLGIQQQEGSSVAFNTGRAAHTPGAPVCCCLQRLLRSFLDGLLTWPWPTAVLLKPSIVAGLDAGRGSTEMRWRRLQGRPVLPACAARRKRCPHSLHGLSDLVHRGNAAILGSIRRRRRFDRSQGMMP